ncbi:hypothetical protein FOA52_015533 [Chlamydomonas sp. UWO 241]|nr:hypothetical protein FOA52_015533 [Chlamydomonas sp. UWO 241]
MIRNHLRTSPPARCVLIYPVVMFSARVAETSCSLETLAHADLFTALPSLYTIYEEPMACPPPASPSPLSLGTLESYKLVEMMKGGSGPSRPSMISQIFTDCFTGRNSAGAATTAPTDEFNGMSTPPASPKNLLCEAGGPVSLPVVHNTPPPQSTRSNPGIRGGVRTESMQAAPGSAPAEVGVSRPRVDQERKPPCGALLSTSGHEGVSVLDAPSTSSPETSRESSDCGDAADVPALEVAPVVRHAKSFTVRDVCLEMVSGLMASHVARTARSVWGGVVKAVPATLPDHDPNV